MASRLRRFVAAYGNRVLAELLLMPRAPIVPNVPVTIDIVGATAGSALTASGLPAGLTLNSAARTITGSVALPGSYAVKVTETLAGRANSPRTVMQTIVVGKSAEIDPTRGSSKYKGGFLLLAEGYRSGQYAARDASGQMNDAVPASLTSPTQAQYAATPGYVTFPGGIATQPLVVDRSRVALDLSTDSFILAFTINMALPSASVFVLGNQVDTTAPGLKLVAAANGNLQPMVTIGGQNVFGNSFGGAIDGTDHRVVIAWDHKSGDLSVALDGAPLTVMPALADPTAGGAATRQATDFFIGGSSVGGTAAQYPAMKLAAMHLLVFNDGLPINLPMVAAQLNALPRRALTNGDLMSTASRRVMVIVNGQSNENGSASVPDATRSRGPLLADGVRPLGGNKGSIWPRLSELAAERGTHLMAANFAIGSTSLIHDWCGVLRAWSANMKVDKGTYVLSGGNVYKATTVPQQTTVSTVQPAGTGTTQTGADNITWTYMAAARAQDVAGYIYPFTDSYFDPNGYFAAAKAQYLKSRGYDLRAAYIAFGQQDWTLGTTRAEFAQGYINAANYWLDAGATVILGVTCYGAAGDFDAWLTSNPAATPATDPATDTAPGIGGWQDALRFFAGNPRIVAGDNSRYALGVIPSAASVGASRAHTIPAMEGDTIHFNAPAQRARAAVLDRAVQARNLW